MKDGICGVFAYHLKKQKAKVNSNFGFLLI